jgi:hypothetical protein
VIVAAALCASPPLLHPALTGRAVVLPELRAACAEAVARLLRGDPELIVVVGPAPATGELAPDGRLDLTAFAPGSDALGSGAPGSVALDGAGALPLSLGLGAMLLDQGGYRGPRRMMAVGAGETAGACAALGAGLASGATRTALLVMGDGSARRNLKAPGHLDPRAEPFDAQVERAVRAGQFGALLELDETLARELMVTGRPAWQVLAGAMTNGSGAGGSGAGGSGAGGSGAGDSGAGGSGAGGASPAEVLYRDDPFGVAYLVACL